MKDQLEDLRERRSDPAVMSSAPMIGRVEGRKPSRALARHLAYRRRQRRDQYRQALVRVRQRARQPQGTLGGYRRAVLRRQDRRGQARSRSRTGAGSKASRSREEIEIVFDRNKSAIYALYSRALREQPELEGKVVVQLTIAPSGEVTECRIVSTELNDPELERKLVARIRMFRFEDKDVEAMTTTKPIEFFPA
jgi:TonB family protein